jgi:hypothetical protein
MEQVKKYSHNIDLLKHNLLNVKINPLSKTNRLALSLGINDDGYHVWDTTEKILYAWTGTAWKASSEFLFTEDLPVVLSSGKTAGKYVNGDIIPAIGKNPQEVLKDIVTEYLNPSFSFFSVNISSLLEVGTTLSGNKTFTWGTTNNSNIATNSLLIRDVTSNTVLGSSLANDGTENLNIGTITNTSPITRNWRIEGINTNTIGFQSNNYTINSIYPVFYGVSNSAPVTNQTLINSGTKAVINSTGTINITFGASGQYLWFAHPASSTTKTKWYVNALDNGNIGSISDLFNLPNIVMIDSPTVLWNGISYKIYFSNTPVNTTGNMELRNL